MKEGRPPSSRRPSECWQLMRKVSTFCLNGLLLSFSGWIKEIRLCISSALVERGTRISTLTPRARGLSNPFQGEIEEHIWEDEGQRPSAATAEMLRYLIKTLLQMNLFTDTLRDATNGTDLFFNISSIPSFNSSLLDWANFTGLNGEHFFFYIMYINALSNDQNKLLIKTNTSSKSIVNC